MKVIFRAQQFDLERKKASLLGQKVCLNELVDFADQEDHRWANNQRLVQKGFERKADVWANKINCLAKKYWAKQFTFEPKVGGWPNKSFLGESVYFGTEAFAVERTKAGAGAYIVLNVPL